MLNNLTGWHFLIVLGVLLTIALVVVVIIVVAIRISRKQAHPSPVSSPDPVEQIQRLATLRDQGLLSEEEFEAKRAELLGRI